MAEVTISQEEYYRKGIVLQGGEEGVAIKVKYGKPLRVLYRENPDSSLNSWSSVTEDKLPWKDTICLEINAELSRERKVKGTLKCFDASVSDLEFPGSLQQRGIPTGPSKLDTPLHCF